MARKCYVCHVRIVSAKEAADPKKTFIEPTCTPHCDSPTCDYCRRCRDVKAEEIRTRG